MWGMKPYSKDLRLKVLGAVDRGAFFKVKTLLKKAAARTREALVEAMGEALSAITPREAAGWFAHCRYEVEGQPS
jgi:hypothetical protein